MTAHLTPQERAHLEERLRRYQEKASLPHTIRPASGDGPWPLSFAQEQLWFLDRLYGENHAYNEPVAYRLRGELDIDALRQALSALVERHEVLRSTYSSGDSAPRQRVQSPVQIPLPVIDLRNLLPEDAENAWREQALAAAHEPFDLQNDVLLRAALYRLSGDDYRLLLVKHHIAHDGWSVPIIARELSALYEAALRREPTSLSPLPLQYKDYAVWQRSDEQRPRFNKSLDYWRERLAALPPLELPTDRPHPPQIDTSGGTITFRIPVEITVAVDGLARAENATRYMVLLSAFFVLLHRYSAQEDFAVGSPVANRQVVELEQLIGFFVNMLVIRGDLSGEPSFRQLLDRTRIVILEALQHQDLPFAQLIAALQPERQMSRNPLFQVAFQVVNRPPSDFKLPGITAETEELDFGIAKFDLDVSLRVGNSGWVGRWRYASAIFDRQTAERMVSHYLRLLQAIVADPDREIGRLPLLTTAERQQLLHDWNDTAVPYPRQSSIHELFAEQVRRSPDKPAVFFGDVSLTYEELNRRAGSLAVYLARSGVQPGDFVGFSLERSLDLIITMLAVLKSGAAYLPLDSDYPRERIAAMLEDAQCRVIITKKDRAENLPGEGFDLIFLDDDRLSTAINRQSRSGTLPLPESSALDPAYIIYTSGSTGRPKGVVIPHRAVVRLVKNTNYADLGPAQRFIQLAPVTFDAATLEIWGPLLNGGSLFIYPPGVVSLDGLAQFLREHQITYLFLTTGLFHQMVEHQGQTLAAIPQVQAGGEVVSPEHVHRLLNQGGICEVSVVYGPTENTTYSSFAPVKSVDDTAQSLPIGRPISNTTLYILDATLQPAPVGVPGELFTGGDGLALGYLNDIELTAERFIPDPFSDEHGARLYRTGDLARYLPDGDIEFLGRIDRQVKIRGHRIEPGEIESQLVAHKDVLQALVVVPGSEKAGKKLAAYVVPAQGRNLQAVELKQFLAQRLPAFMIPLTITFLTDFPLKANGKIDQQALPAPDRHQEAAANAYVAPRDSLERDLAAIFSGLLDVDKVSIHDNFFELGGHSLLTTQLLARIHAAFDVDLPLSAVVLEPRISEIAPLVEELRLAQRADQPRKKAGLETIDEHPAREPQPFIKDQILVPIKEGGDLEPLFCVHSFSGNISYYTDLIRAMTDRRPVYGLIAVGLNAGEQPDTTIEAMAARYIDVMRGVQPRGPYRIGGYCLGGVIAFEMARQLESAGESTALLAIMDANAPNRQRLHLPFLSIRRWRTVVRHIPLWMRDYFSQGVAGFGRRLRREVSRSGKLAVKRLGVDVEMNLQDFIIADLSVVPDQHRLLLETQFRALRNYTPQPIGGRLTVFAAGRKSAGRALAGSLGPEYGWDPLAQGGVDTIVFDCFHKEFLRGPNAALLAAILQERLRAADVA